MKHCFSSFLIVLGFSTASYAQTMIEVKFEAVGPVGLAPLIAAFSDGSFDIFDAGSAASSALEDLAETGSPAGFSPPNGGAVLGPGVGPGSPPIYAPGAMASERFSVDDGNGMFVFASMLLPSNDWFIGNDTAFDVSSLLNAPLGTSMSFDIAMVYDAGTELEDFDASAGNGLVGVTNPGDGGPNVGTGQGGVVSMVTGPDPFAAFANLEPAGLDTTAFDFTGGNVARITLTTVPEPSSAILLLLGVLPFVRPLRRR